jgi:EmrB/QacA subfamily drug resistance transporter
MGVTESVGRQQSVAGRSGAPSKGWTLALMALAYSMCALDGLVVITALPAIGRDLNASASTLQWTVNAYVITWASCMITAAVIADLVGRRRMFLGGLLLFTVASVACALSPDMAVLVTARAVQGIGAAIILPLSLTILAGVFPPERRGTMIGIWGGIGGLAVACGPLVGGALTQSLDWHWIFWLNVPIGLVVAFLSRLRLAESYGSGRRLDVPGVVLVTVGAAVTIWAMIQGGDLGWGSPQVVVGLVVGLVLLAAFVVWEGRAPDPMLPLRLFRSRSFSAANIASFLMSGALYASSVYMAQYFQGVRGVSPLKAGLEFLPMMAMPLFIAPLAGAISDKVGQRALIVTGLFVETIGLTWLALAATTDAAYGGLVTPLFLTGLGFAMALMTAPTAAIGAVPPADMGKASGTNGTLQRFGSAFGVAIATAVFAANGHLGSPASVSAGVQPALFVAAGFALCGAVAGLGIRGKQR